LAPAASPSAVRKYEADTSVNAYAGTGYKSAYGSRNKKCPTLLAADQNENSVIDGTLPSSSKAVV
jgi:hypothetical protein